MPTVTDSSDGTSTEHVYTDLTGDASDAKKAKPDDIPEVDAGSESALNAGDFSVFPADTKS